MEATGGFALPGRVLLGEALAVVCANPVPIAISGNRIERARVVRAVLMCFPLNALFGIGL